jgi:hypothetical protein
LENGSRKTHSCITSPDADSSLVEETCDLNVSRGLDELTVIIDIGWSIRTDIREHFNIHGCECSRRYKTGTVAWLCAIGYNDAFYIPDNTIRFWSTP